jgi:hypothetical protein
MDKLIHQAIALLKEESFTQGSILATLKKLPIFLLKKNSYLRKKKKIDRD